MQSNEYLKLDTVRLKPSRQWQAELRNVLYFVFPQTGNLTHEAGASTERIIEGDILVVQGGADNCLFPADSHETTFRLFSARMEHLFPLFSSEEVGLLQRVMQGYKKMRLYPAASPAAAECRRLLERMPEEVDLKHRSQLLRVAAALLSVEFDKMRKEPWSARLDDHLGQSFSKLSVEDMLTCSVGELADRFNCSRRHLNRLFHQQFGVSVASFRMEIRLLKAASLLRDPDLKIINVADQCGFNHLGLFNEVFKRRFGLTPGQWRIEAQSPAVADPNGKPEPPCRLRISGLCPWANSLAHEKPASPPGSESAITRPKRSSGAPRPASKVDLMPVTACSPAVAVRAEPACNVGA